MILIKAYKSLISRDIYAFNIPFIYPDTKAYVKLYFNNKMSVFRSKYLGCINTEPLYDGF